MVGAGGLDDGPGPVNGMELKGGVYKGFLEPVHYSHNKLRGIFIYSFFRCFHLFVSTFSRYYTCKFNNRFLI